MATTQAQLEAEDVVPACWVLAIEGVDYLATTTSDTAGIVTAWSATEWTTVKAGLYIPGSLDRSIVPFDAELQVSSLTVRIQDVDDTLFCFHGFSFLPSS